VTGCYDAAVRLWDGANVALLSTSPQPNQVASLAAAPDGRLACALAGGTTAMSVVIWTPDGREAQSYRGLPTAVRALAWSPDGRLLAGADTVGAIQIWDSLTGATFRRLAGSGAMRMAAAWSADGRRVAWGDRWTGTTSFAADSELTASFEPFAAAPGPPVKPEPGWVRAVVRQGSLYLAPPADFRGVSIAENGRELARTIPEQYYDTTRCASFTPGGEVVVGAAFSLRQSTATGQLKRIFVGHTGEVAAVSCSPDGRYLASAAGDQTVRLWSLAPAGPAAVDQVAPLLSIFIGADNRWVAWTPEGYYACSPGGEQIIGWQVTAGWRRLPTTTPPTRFAVASTAPTWSPACWKPARSPGPWHWRTGNGRRPPMPPWWPAESRSSHRRPWPS